MALASEVAQFTVMVLPLAEESVTLNVAVVEPALPSVTETSFTERVGGRSSSVIVPTPEPSEIVALPGLDRVRLKDSLTSSRTSPFTVTPIVVPVAPAAIVRLPMAETKSVPAVAEPAEVAQSRVTALALAEERLTLNVAVVVPALPSVTVTSFTERVGGRSSSVIVARPCASPICPGDPTRLVRFTTNVSFASSVASPRTGTDTTLEAPVFVSETVPDEAVKSAGDVADPGAVAQLTCSAQQGLGAGAAWIVKLALTLPPVPSVTVTSVIVTIGLGAAVAGAGAPRTNTAAAAAPAARRRTGARKPRSWRARNPKSMKRASTRGAHMVDTRSGVFRFVSPALEQV